MPKETVKSLCLELLNYLKLNSKFGAFDSEPLNAIRNILERAWDDCIAHSDGDFFLNKRPGWEKVNEQIHVRVLKIAKMVASNTTQQSKEALEDVFMCWGHVDIDEEEIIIDDIDDEE